MKHFILITFLSFITLTNCSINNNDDGKQQVYKTYWHLTNVSGGIAGVDNDFDLDKIIWSFDNTTGKLTINNTNTDDTIEDGFDSGVYNYTVTIVESDEFLVIESNEFGNVVATETQLIIDQNITTSGTGTDGFVYTFKRVVILEDVE
ncbi:hypothetical protein VP395_13655 [Mariniflexile soesokkakense]|uniref:Lipocalin-like domain-containing protein n=1 Tax=Mariniflexile soesokkakense TaxID=1343160 RepID=A0ABV0AGW8_9FLAO